MFYEGVEMKEQFIIVSHNEYADFGYNYLFVDFESLTQVIVFGIRDLSLVGALRSTWSKYDTFKVISRYFR